MKQDPYFAKDTELGDLQAQLKRMEAKTDAIIIMLVGILVIAMCFLVP